MFNVIDDEPEEDVEGVVVPDDTDEEVSDGDT